MKYQFTQTIKKVGNSHSIIIPIEWIKVLQLNEGDKILLEIKTGDTNETWIDKT